MKTVYVVMSHEGAYEDYVESIIRVCADQKKSEALVKQLMIELEEVDNRKRAAKEEFRKIIKERGLEIQYGLDMYETIHKKLKKHAGIRDEVQKKHQVENIWPSDQRGFHVVIAEYDDE